MSSPDMRRLSSRLSEYLRKEWNFVKLGASVVFLSATQMSILFVTMVFAGHLGQAHLDGIGLSNTIYGLCMAAICFGYSTTFDTYGPQVYGSKNKCELGTVLQKCLLQGALLNLLFLGLFYNVVHIINILPNTYESINKTQSIVEEIVAEKNGDDFKEIAAEYLRMIALLGILDYCIVLLSRYFAIQGKTSFVYVVSFSMMITHIALNYLLVTVAGLKIYGIVLASYMGRLIALSISCLLCFFMIKRGQFMWNGFSKKSLLGWKPMLKLGLSGWINVIAEMGLFEISVFCSQFDGAAALSAVIIANQIQGVVWSITSGICCASATLIGTALGEGNKKEVKLYMIFSVLNVIVASVILATVEFIMQRTLAEIFSPDPEVLRLFIKTFWILAVILPVDHLQVVLNRGILTAFGKQRFIAVSMSVICYGIGMPIILCSIFFTDLIVSGVYLGYSAFFVAAALSAGIRISRFNLDEELEKTKIRVKSTDHQIADSYVDVVGTDNPVYSTDNDEITLTEQGFTNAASLDEKDPDIVALREESFLYSRDEQKEMRNVLIAFFVALIWFITLSGLSLIT